MGHYTPELAFGDDDINIRQNVIFQEDNINDEPMTLIKCTSGPTGTVVELAKGPPEPIVQVIHSVYRDPKYVGPPNTVHRCVNYVWVSSNMFKSLDFL